MFALRCLWRLTITGRSAHIEKRKAEWAAANNPTPLFLLLFVQNSKVYRYRLDYPYGRQSCSLSCPWSLSLSCPLSSQSCPLPGPCRLSFLMMTRSSPLISSAWVSGLHYSHVGPKKVGRRLNAQRTGQIEMERRGTFVESGFDIGQNKSAETHSLNKDSRRAI